MKVLVDTNIFDNINFDIEEYEGTYNLYFSGYRLESFTSKEQAQEAKRILNNNIYFIAKKLIERS